MAVTQKHRIAAVSSPLGDDSLVFRQMSMSERLSTLFAIDLEVASLNEQIDFDLMLGQNMTVRLELSQGKTRYYNGFVSQFAQGGQEEDYFIYYIVLKPWLWFLTKTSDCRIFQDKTIPEIIKEVFQGQGFTDYDERLTGRYAKHTYCVQYRETDFDFVSRLMEQEGIYYYFVHENGNHKLVLADGYSSHQPVVHYETVPYYPPNSHDRRKRDHVHTWSFQREIQTGRIALTDFDFTKSRSNLATKSSIIKPHPGAKFERYDYPGSYEKVGKGNEYARVRIEQLHAETEIAKGRGNLRGFYAGGLFTLENFPRQDQNKEYLLVEVNCEIHAEAYRSTSGGGEGLYSCDFEVIDSRQPFRAPRTTRKPFIPGPQTALVVGKDGEEIWTDEYGRVKVRFHWDRYSKADEASSCWIRVAQVWAGKNWGAMYIPRIGQEVIVEFLEGDPDRPIITGRVYNDACKPPYELPAEQTKSALKSNSSKGGGGFNEIRFEDKKGEEQIFIHAEKDSDLRVEKDSREWTGHDRHLHVVNEQLELVDKDKHSTVNGNRNTEISQSDSLKVGSEKHDKVGMLYALDSGQQIHLKAGMTAVIEAGVNLTLKVGGNFITINPAGVTIQGVLVNINSGGSAGSGSGSRPDKPRLPEDADNAKAGGVAEAVLTTDNVIEKQTFTKSKVEDFSEASAADMKAASLSGIGFVR